VQQQQQQQEHRRQFNRPVAKGAFIYFYLSIDILAPDI